MISKPIVFSSKIEELVKKFDKSKLKSSETWNNEEYSPVIKEIKDYYLAEQDFTCPFCRQKFIVKHNRVWDIEHIIPKSTHPQFLFEPENLCVICPDCNIEKNAQSVLDRGSRKKFTKKSNHYRIYHPHFDKYEDHLEVVVIGQLYRILSKKGRNTFRVYGLERFLCESVGQRAYIQEPEVRRLHSSALLARNTIEYEKIETQLLRKILLKRSAKIGASETVAILSKLEES